MRRLSSVIKPRDAMWLTLPIAPQRKSDGNHFVVVELHQRIAAVPRHHA
ncbi:MAG: hypothetical protein ABI114_16135 [Rhodanobacter sp.]